MQIGEWGPGKLRLSSSEFYAKDSDLGQALSPQQLSKNMNKLNTMLIWY
jgi:hypothetical protein